MRFRWDVVVIIAWVTAVLGVVSLVAAVAVPLEPALSSPPQSRDLVLLHRTRTYPADSLAAATVRRNPFRYDRRPAATLYGSPTTSVVRAPVVARPTLLLVGVVTASDPTAVVEGIPDVRGARVLRVGDEVSGFRVQGIEDGAVRIVGLDTAWTLTVRNPW